MFHRDPFSGAPRPLTGSELEAAAEHEKWGRRRKTIEAIIGILTLSGGIGAMMGGKEFRRVCDSMVLVMALLALAFYKKTRRPSQ